MARVIQKKKKFNIRIPYLLIFNILLTAAALTVLGFLAYEYIFKAKEDKVLALFRDCEACETSYIQDYYTRDAVSQEEGGPGIRGFLRDKELDEIEETEIYLFVYNSNLKVYSEEIQKFILEDFDEQRPGEQYLKKLIEEYVHLLNRGANKKFFLLDMYKNEEFIGSKIPNSELILAENSLACIRITSNVKYAENPNAKDDDGFLANNSYKFEANIYSEYYELYQLLVRANMGIVPVEE